MKPLATRHCDLKFVATPNMYLYKYKTKGQLISEDFFLSSDTLKHSVLERIWIKGSYLSLRVWI